MLGPDEPFERLARQPQSEGGAGLHLLRESGQHRITSKVRLLGRSRTNEESPESALESKLR